MIRVLVVETTVFSHDGITNVMTNYFIYQDHSKVHMDVVTINPVSERFNEILDKYGSKNYVFPFRNHNPVKYVHELKKILKQGRYSILHVHGCSATMAVEMLAAKLAGVKIRISHSHNTACDHVTADKILRPFFNRWCNVGFACGKEAGEWLFPGKEFTVISNGIDVDRYSYNADVRAEFRSKYGLEGKTVIGHVGRFSEQKNHRKLIDIFAAFSRLHQDAKLVLVGDGELRPEIEERAKRENLDVLFVGLSDEVEKWLQAMDIIVFPSLFEGLPLGLVEAQAAGLPCVLSNTISPDTKITNLVRYVDLEADPKQWCEVIEEMLSNSDRSADCDQAKTDIQNKHFDIRANCAELYQKYVQLESGL